MTDLTAETIAPRLRAAFERRDAAKLRDLLDPDVRWGGEEDTPDTCHNRAQVLARFGWLAVTGTKASITNVEVDGERIVLTWEVTEPEERAGRHRQTFTVARGRVVDIRPA